MKKYFIKILAPLIVVVIVFCTFGGYVIYKKLELINNCTRIHSGNVAVEIVHDGYKVKAGGGTPFFIEASMYNKNGNNEFVVVRLDKDYVKTVDELVLEGDPGPRYSKIMFNGREAAYYNSPDEGEGFSIDKYHVFPGNRSLDIIVYKYNNVNDNFDFSNIKIVNTKDDIKEARVEECGINN